MNFFNDLKHGLGTLGQVAKDETSAAAGKAGGFFKDVAEGLVKIVTLDTGASAGAPSTKAQVSSIPKQPDLRDEAISALNARSLGIAGGAKTLLGNVARGAEIGAGTSALNQQTSQNMAPDFKSQIINTLQAAGEGAVGGAALGGAGHLAVKGIENIPKLNTKLGESGFIAPNEPLKSPETKAPETKAPDSFFTTVKSEAPAKKITETYQIAEDLKPIQSKFEGLLKTQNKQVRTIKSEINKLEKKGLTQSLKSEGINAMPDFLPEKLGDLKTSETRSFVKSLIEKSPAEITKLKKMVATRENKLGPIFDKISEMSDALGGVKNIRESAIKQGKLLRRQGVDEEATRGIVKVLKTAPQDLKDHFTTWINSRSATELEGVAAKRMFSKLDAEGPAAFDKIQSGDKTGDFGQLSDYFRGKYFQLKESGIGQKYQQNYLPQLWKNDATAVDRVFGSTVSEKPGFTISKVIRDYKKGIELGLEPRFKTVSDLVGWYEKTANKAIADKNFLDGMKKSGRLIEASKAPAGWKAINPDFAPGKVYKAEPAVADAINNYLGKGSEFLSKTAHIAGRLKGITLGAGVPGTGLNWHGTVNILPRVLLAQKGPISGLKEGLRTAAWMAKPSLAEKYFNTNFAEATRLAKSGLTVSSEEHAYARNSPVTESRSLSHPFKGKVSELQQKWFEDPLFGKVMPALKVRNALGLEKEFLKKGISPEEAAKAAAENSNNLFGGINIDELTRDKQFQQFVRSFGLAPDFVESNLRLGVGVVKGFTKKMTDPQFVQYRRMGRNLLLAYVASNVINKAVSGHWMFQNAANNQWSIETGTKDANGKNRTVPLFGGSVDFARLPYDLVYGITTGNANVFSNIIRGRLSPPVAAALSLVSNTNPAAGNAPILGPDKYGNPQGFFTQLGNVGQVAGQAVLPQQVQSAVGVATGKTSVEQGVATALELPVRYQTPKKGRTVSAGKTVRKARKGSSKVKKVRRGRVARKVRVKRAKLKTVTKV